jgi:hypothetical protein
MATNQNSHSSFTSEPANRPSTRGRHGGTRAKLAQPVVTEPWPFKVCGSCGQHEFTTTNRAGHLVFHCVACRALWRYTLGYLIPVDPSGVEQARAEG